MSPLSDGNLSVELAGAMRASPMRLVLTLATCACARGADSSKPHPHQGTLEPFKAGPPPSLTAAEARDVAAGKTVTKTVKLPGMGARAMAVFDVKAPPDIVWDAILDVRSYPRMVQGVVECEPYDGPTSLGGGATRTRARWTLSFVGYRVSYFVEMLYQPRLDSMTFRLDYSRDSDIDDTVGHWHVVAVPGPDGATYTRVSYSAALTLRMWLPKYVVDLLFATTLGQATSWVAPEATKRLAASGRTVAPTQGGAATAVAARTCRWTWRGRRCKSVPPPPPPPPAAPSPFRQALDQAVTAFAILFTAFAAMNTARG